MKAYLRRNLLIFFKSGNFIIWLIGIVLMRTLGALSSTYFYALVYFGILNSCLAHREAGRKSGGELYESFWSVPHEKKAAAEYLQVFVSCMIFSAVCLISSPWCYRFFRLFPFVSLLPAGLTLPWEYLSRKDSVRTLTAATAILCAWFIFTWCRNLPLVIRTYPFWQIACINLIMMIIYISSYLLAVSFIKKKGGSV